MNNHENNRGNLLLELFSEEIPARMQADSEKQLENLFTSFFLLGVLIMKYVLLIVGQDIYL